MFKNLKISSKIISAFVIIAVVSVGLIGYLTFSIGRTSLEREAFNKLTAVREMKASQIEEYFKLIADQIITLSEDRMIIEAMYAFEAAHHTIIDDLELTEAQRSAMDAGLSEYYQTQFLRKLAENQEQTVTLEAYWPADLETRVLQSLYISENEYFTGSKHFLNNPEDGSSYSAAHEIHHPIIRDYLERFGYYDIFLVDIKTGGHITYSVFKEVDFGTSLTAGPYRNTNFAKVYQAALAAEAQDFVMLVDFESYAPSYNAPAAFIASPIFDYRINMASLYKN